MVLDVRIWYDTPMWEYALLGPKTPKWVGPCDLYICIWSLWPRRPLYRLARCSPIDPYVGCPLRAQRPFHGFPLVGRRPLCGLALWLQVPNHLVTLIGEDDPSGPIYAIWYDCIGDPYVGYVICFVGDSYMNYVICLDLVWVMWFVLSETLTRFMWFVYWRPLCGLCDLFCRRVLHELCDLFTEDSHIGYMSYLHWALLCGRDPFMGWHVACSTRYEV